VNEILELTDGEDRMAAVCILFFHYMLNSSPSPSIVINSTSIAVIEEGGRSAARPLRRFYKDHVAGFIFVVDSNDRKGIDQARDKLHQMFNTEDWQHKPFLILANK
jgi:GTPase SAR1 family protein